MDEINKIVEKALDSGVSSYYRKDAIRQLSRLHKSAQLTKAVIRLLNDLDDESLQRETMDIAGKFAITEAVNLLMPISGGKGMNARHAINVLAKIGGKKAYDSLSKIASLPGFNLSKTAASRAMEEMRRRQPGIEKEEEAEANDLLESAEELAKKLSEETKNTFNDITELVSDIAESSKGVAEEISNGLTETVDKAITKAAKTAERIKSDVETKVSEAKTNTAAGKKEKTENVDVNTSVKDQKKISELTAKLSHSETIITQKEDQILRLQNEVTALKKKTRNDGDTELKQNLAALKDENARIKASYEKKLTLQAGKINALEDVEKSARKLRSRSHKKNNSQSGSGCAVVIFIVVAIYILSKMFNF